MSTVHDFAAYKARSNSEADQAFWRARLLELWPSLAGLVFLPDDGPGQRAGADAVIVLRTSVNYRVDFKLRETAYADVLLEYLSDEERGAPGWVCKPVLTDWIVYAWRPTSRAIALPVPQLQDAWRRNGDAWVARFGTKRARNRTWTTLSTPVPIDALFPAVGGCLRTF